MKLRNLFVRIMFGGFVLSSFLMPLGTVAFEDEVFFPFSDVPNGHVNAKAVNHLWSEDVIVGYEDGTFGVDKEINRAEFLKIVMEMTDYELDEDVLVNCYTDVKDEWYAPYVCGATNLGHVSGHPDGSFRPGDEINFAEASKIIINIVKPEIAMPADDSMPWFFPYVTGLEAVNSIPSSIASFDHKVTRGEMAEMVWRVATEEISKVTNTYDNLVKGKTVFDPGYAGSGDGSYQEFTSCGELQSYFEYTSENTKYKFFESEDMAVPMTVDAVEESVGESFGDSSSGDVEYSTTNIQVAGVDEADIVKTDGEFIYVLKGNSVRIVKAYPAEDLMEYATIEIGDTDSGRMRAEDMYVDEDRLAVVVDNPRL